MSDLYPPVEPYEQPPRTRSPIPSSCESTWASSGGLVSGGSWA
jgi:hypothetical protein